MDRKLVPRKISPLNEFFIQDKPAEESQGHKAPTVLKISQLVPFAEHPFKLYEGQRLEDMVESIKENGVITPIIVRPKEGHIEVNGVMLPLYEILSGHNRWNGSKVAELEDIPSIIKEGQSDAEAKLIVIETNFMQRSVADMLPSELAKSLKMQLDACKEANRKQELLKVIQKDSNPREDWDSGGSAQFEQRQWSVEKVADNNKMSRANIQRYIRLNNLIEEFLNKVDEEKVGLIPAVSLSYLKEAEQRGVLESMKSNSFKIDIAKADMLRSYSEAGTLNAGRIYTVLSGAKKKPGRQVPIKVNPKIISRFFTQGQKPAEINEVIEKALESYLSSSLKV